MVPDSEVLDFFYSQEESESAHFQKRLKTTLKNKNKKTNQGSGVDAVPLQTGRSDLSRLSPRVSTASFSLPLISQTHLPPLQLHHLQSFFLKNQQKTNMHLQHFIQEYNTK